MVKVRESRERERRDKRSSMATQVKREAGGRPERERQRGESQAKRGQVLHVGIGQRRTEGSSIVTDGAVRAAQMFQGGLKEVMSCQVLTESKR